MNCLVLAHADLVAALGMLLAHPGAVAVSRLGFNRTAGRELLLAGPFTIAPFLPHISREPPAIVLSYRPDAACAETEAVAILRSQGPPSQGHVSAALVWAGRRTQTHGSGCLWRAGGHIEPFAEIRVVGPGLPVLRRAEKPGPCVLAGRWSRLLGALGGPVLARIQTARFTLIGCGRNGSLVATTLARMGVKHLALIDPDRLELHNLDAMDTVLPADVGQFKAEALAQGLCRISDTIEVQTFTGSLTALAALPLIQSSDFLISCVDDDGARWAATALATLYLKPLLDIGTGVFGSGRIREIGADVRLTVPGECCLSCFGGFANIAQIAALRASQASEQESRQSAWPRGRTGSLRSLNQTATGFAIRLLEEFWAARLDGSRWLRLIFNNDGEPLVTKLRPTANTICTLCARRGGADGELKNLRALPPILNSVP